MPLNWVNHVAILIKDNDRLAAFYREVFGAEVAGHQDFEGAQRALCPHRRDR
jgi:catechol 2,3-dioxygenase-like lactoylglutathione lyase family enzyme